MNIGEASFQSGLPSKTIRYYEDKGLVKPGRRESGYRDFSSDDVQLLKFVRGARAHGFTIEECRKLLTLYLDRSRASAHVKKFARAKILDIDAEISKLNAKREELMALTRRCKGDESSECAILDGFVRY